MGAASPPAANAPQIGECGQERAWNTTQRRLQVCKDIVRHCSDAGEHNGARKLVVRLCAQNHSDGSEGREVEEFRAMRDLSVRGPSPPPFPPHSFLLSVHEAGARGSGKMQPRWREQNEA